MSDATAFLVARVSSHMTKPEMGGLTGSGVAVTHPVPQQISVSAKTGLCILHPFPCGEFPGANQGFSIAPGVFDQGFVVRPLYFPLAQVLSDCGKQGLEKCG